MAKPPSQACKWEANENTFKARTIILSPVNNPERSIFYYCR